MTQQPGEHAPTELPRPGRFGDVRRSVRPRGPRPRARGARRGPQEGHARPRLPRRARAPPPHLHRPTQPHHRGPAVRRARRRGPGHPQARGPQPHRLAQDQQRAGAGAADQADGQDPGHRRDRRRPARRRHGHRRRPDGARLHASTWARSTPSGRRSTSPGCGCSAPRWSRSRTGSATLKDAINEALRDWVTNVATTHYLLGTVTGPHPFPEMVRDFHRIIGVEARGAGARPGRPPPRRRHRLRRRRLQRDGHLPPVHRRRGGPAGRHRGRGRGHRVRPSCGTVRGQRRPGSCTARSAT